MDIGAIDRAWVEITKDTHSHGGAGWEFGKCLWSPTTNKAGDDRYSLMRAPKPNEAVIHFLFRTWENGVAESRLCGISRVTKSHRILKQAPPEPGEWVNRDSYYRIDVADFSEITPGLPLNLLTTAYAEEIAAELREDQPRFYPFNTFGSSVRTVQGIYLAYATPRLMRLIKSALKIEGADTQNTQELENRHNEYAEGERRKRESNFFTRNPKLVEDAKKKYRYACQACGFRFEEVYGALGKNFIECHHLNPLSERSDNGNSPLTNLDEVTVLCSNCHRMIHRCRPALSLEELRYLVQGSRCR